jgi:hypothetical protein
MVNIGILEAASAKPSALFSLALDEDGDVRINATVGDAEILIAFIRAKDGKLVAALLSGEDAKAVRRVGIKLTASDTIWTA